MKSGVACGGGFLVRGLITYSFVNSFTNEEVIPRTTRVALALGVAVDERGFSFIYGKKPRLARAFGRTQSGNELELESWERKI